MTKNYRRKRITGNPVSIFGAISYSLLRLTHRRFNSNYASFSSCTCIFYPFPPSGPHHLCASLTHIHVLLCPSELSWVDIFLLVHVNALSTCLYLPVYNCRLRLGPFVIFMVLVMRL